MLQLKVCVTVVTIDNKTSEPVIIIPSPVETRTRRTRPAVERYEAGTDLAFTGGIVLLIRRAWVAQSFYSGDFEELDDATVCCLFEALGNWTGC